ncbi:MAG: hypothetical protein K0R09_2551 [Clostridiales bacterium]|jgi:hypothetical protein|nr:hypothetical protein [Clostridiales bacterium]
MKISIEDELVNLKKDLMNLGYEVYNFSQNVTSDAYIYSEEKTGLHNFSNSIEPTLDGSLLIDADGKSINEIQYILSHRLYSPLFKITSNDRDLV